MTKNNVGLDKIDNSSNHANADKVQAILLFYRYKSMKNRS